MDSVADWRLCMTGYLVASQIHENITRKEAGPISPCRSSLIAEVRTCLTLCLQ